MADAPANTPATITPDSAIVRSNELLPDVQIIEPFTDHEARIFHLQLDLIASDRSFQEERRERENQHQHQIQELLQRIQQLETRYQQLETRYRHLETSHQQLETRYRHLETSHQQLKTDNAQLKTDNAQLKTDNAIFRQKIASLENNFTVLAGVVAKQKDLVGSHNRDMFSFRTNSSDQAALHPLLYSRVRLPAGSQSADQNPFDLNKRTLEMRA